MTKNSGMNVVRGEHLLTESRNATGVEFNHEAPPKDKNTCTL